MHVDVTATAVTPLLARGHAAPGEELHHTDIRQSGGSEQFMHMRGDLRLGDEHHRIDCHHIRDRSWNQIRTEDQGGAGVPAIGWSPMYFGDDLAFNQISFEPRETNPAWADGFDTPAGFPTHHFAWVVVSGEHREVVEVTRDVHAYHPTLYTAVSQTITARDEAGDHYTFTGRAIAAANIPQWPNASFRDAVYRWEDSNGRAAYSG